MATNDLPNNTNQCKRAHAGAGAGVSGLNNNDAAAGPTPPTNPRPSVWRRLVASWPSEWEVAGGCLLLASWIGRGVASCRATELAALQALPGVEPIDTLAADLHNLPSRSRLAAVSGLVASKSPLRQDGSVVVRREARVVDQVTASRVAKPAASSTRTLSTSTPAPLPNDAAVGRTTPPPAPRNQRDTGGGGHQLEVTTSSRRRAPTVTTESAPWFLADGSARHATAAPSLGSPPLTSMGEPTRTALPSRPPTRVSTSGSEVVTSVPVAVEVSERVLTIGAWLTLVGKASLTSDGNVSLSAGCGPAIISDLPFDDIVAKFRSRVSSARGFTKLLALSGILCVAYGVYQRLREE